MNIRIGANMANIFIEVTTHIVLTLKTRQKNGKANEIIEINKCLLLNGQMLMSFVIVHAELRLNTKTDTKP